MKRGLKGFQAIADSMMLMKKEEGVKNRLWVRGRRMADNEYVVEVDVTKPGVVSLMDAEDAVSRTTPERRGIMDLLEDGSIWTVPDLADALGKSESSVRQSLFRMVKDGQVERVKRGHYQRVMTDNPIDFDV